MPGINGIEVAKAIGARAHVVFVTAFDRHAIEAFESGAVDYLVKPVTAQRLATTVERLKTRLGSVPGSLESMFAQLADSLTHEGEVLIKKPIKALIEELDPAMFRQVHRSTVVSLKEVKALVHNDSGHGVIHLKTRPETLAVSDAYLHLFTQM